MIEIEVLDRGPLTEKEAKVLKLISEGAKNDGVASSLFMSVKTVETHLNHIYEKLDIQTKALNSRSIAISKAWADGMIRLKNVK